MKKKLGIIILIISIIMIGIGIYFMAQDKTYIVKFVGIETEITQEVSEGNYVRRPEDPTKEGYEFLGWYNKEVLFNFNTKITEDIVLEAKWQESNLQDTYTVTFDTDGGSSIDPVKVAKGELLQKPVDPTKEGFIFDKWYVDNVEYDFNREVTSDITLKATWKKQDGNSFVVTFNSDGGSKINSQTVEKDGTVNKPVNPTKQGYTFVSWQLDGKDYDFSTKVTQNITLKAVWKKVDTFTVTFNSDGGSTVKSQSVEKNKTATKPANPTKAGKIFVSWQLNGKDYDFSTKVIQNITLKAVWRNPNSYTVTFDTDGGSSITSKTVSEGKTISKPADPTKEGFIFVSWQLNGKDYNFSSSITSNITLKAVWREDTSSGN
ncbi:MAG: InlB B-repeat-containing protein [Bacilli bacterium]